MVYKTYISKFNTIISNSKLNTGINPISELVYGHDNIVSRALLYFDHTQVKKLMDDGIMPNMSKMKHVLHITNAGSIDFTQLHQKETSSINDNKKIRATSFDIIFFLIPKPWDRGKGFDYSRKVYIQMTPFQKNMINSLPMRTQSSYADSILTLVMKILILTLQKHSISS